MVFTTALADKDVNHFLEDRMKKVLIVLALAVGLAFTAAAEGTVASAQGTFGLEFSLAGFGTFGLDGVPVGIPGFDGATLGPSAVGGVGIKYYAAKKLNIGVSAFVGGASTTNEAGETDSDLLLALKPSVNALLLSKGPVGIFAGAYLSYGLYSFNHAQSDSTLSSSIFGLGATIGGEYFIGNGVSLGADYSLGANFFSYALTAGAATANGSSMDWGVGTPRVFITLYI